MKYFSKFLLTFSCCLLVSLQIFVFTPNAFSSDHPEPPPPPSPPYLQKPVDPNFDGTYLVSWANVECAPTYQLQEADNLQFTNAVNFYLSGNTPQKEFSKTTEGTFYYRVKVRYDVAESISKRESLFKSFFAWVKNLFPGQKAYAQTPCNQIYLNTIWSNVQSISITKPTSFIDGVVYQAGTEIPIADAVITSPDFSGSATSGADGKFSFGFQTLFPETGKLLVTINIEKAGNTSAQRVVEVTATQHAAAGPIHLTTLDPVITTITPSGGTHVNSTNEIELVFPSGAVTEPIEVNSTKYQQGKALPNELPETSFFTYALNLNAQTSALYRGAKKKVTTFQQPITMRVANTLHFAAGTPIPAGVYNEATKQWEDTGLMGHISADGQWLEFQIDHFSPWDLNLPAVPPSRDQQVVIAKNNSQDIIWGNSECIATNTGCSEVGIKDGILYISHELPEIKRLNSSLRLTLSYNSLTAQPSSLVSIETNLDTATTNIPATSTFKLNIAGREAQATYQGVSGKARYAYLFDGKNSQGNSLPTGNYSYDIEASNNYTNATYWTTNNFAGTPIANTGVVTTEPVPLTRKINGNLVVNNQQNSVFGAGWNLAGLERLHFSADGSILLTQGDGSSMVISTRREPLALTANWHGNNSSVIDYQENSLIGNITLTNAGYPVSVSLTPDGRRAFIAHAYSALVSVVDTVTKREEKTINAQISQSCWLGINPGGTELCLSDMTGNKIRLIDAVTLKPKDIINVGTSPCGLVYSHDGSKIYVANRVSNTISVIDTRTKTVTATLNAGNYPHIIDITNDDKFLYVPNKYAQTVSVIDLVSGQIIKTINVGTEPTGVGVTPDNKYVLVDNLVSDTVSVIDTAVNEVIATIPNIIGPAFMDFTPDSKYAYIAERDANSVAVIDLNNFTVAARINVGSAPHGIGIAAGENLVTPLGDYSTFISNADATFTRVMKDGARINFNAQGLETSSVDRNGNTTSYQYTDANFDGKIEELSWIVLPAGGNYHFIYDSNGKLQSITDPAGRITQTTVDANGDLTQIKNPDNSTLNFVYNNHLLTNKTTERGFTTEYQYDNYGRVKKTITPINPQEERQYFPSDVQGLINDLAPGVGTPTNPAPVVRPDDITERVIDGKGYTTTSKTSKFGAYAKITDALSQVTTIDRDTNNNPIKITRPNNSTVSMSYDAKGNLLTSTEDSILATTTFTYEPNFNQVTSIKDARDNSASIEYDSKGNPIQITDALGNITKMEYNAKGQVNKIIAGFGTALENNTLFGYYSNTLNLQTITDPLNNVTTFTYDDSGNILTSTDANNKTTTFEYDLMGRLTKVTDPDSKVTQYQYDEAGNLKKIIDAKLNQTNFTYDEINQLKTIVNPLNKTKTFTYDLNRNLKTVTDFKGQTIDFSYDEINRLTGKLANSQTIVSFGYDSVNNLTSALDSDSSLTLGYDLAGRLTSATTANLGHQPATSMSFTFDKNSNRLTLADPNSVITKYVYDALNRLSDITDASDVNIAHFGFDELSRRNALSFANSTSTAYGYDLASRLTSLVITGPTLRRTITPAEELLRLFDDFLTRNAFAVSASTVNSALSTVNSYAYTYDSVGNRLTMTDGFGTHTYGYDYLYRLTSATLPTEAYTYDNVGNRNPASFVYDAANRLLDDSVYTYTYDDNGNCITKTNKSNPSDVTTYTYNIENQLVSVDSGLLTVDYIYDGLGRRIEKNVNGTITRYVYDNEDIIAEYDGSNNLVAKYLHGPGIDEPIRMERGGQKYFYHSDGLGSVTAITNSTGSTVNTYRYDAFGNIISQTGTLVNPYTYTGREYDSETGLYYYRNRYYNPTIGQFIQEDPFNDLRGLSLYSYVKNSPLNYLDPYGLWGVQFGNVNFGIGDPTLLFDRSSLGYLGQSFAATADGFIPFVDPFRSSYNQCDMNLQISKYLGAFSRDVFIAAAATAAFEAASTSTIIKTRSSTGITDNAISQIIKVKSKITGNTLKVIHKVTSQTGEIIEQHFKFRRFWPF